MIRATRTIHGWKRNIQRQYRILCADNVDPVGGLFQKRERGNDGESRSVRTFLRGKDTLWSTMWDLPRRSCVRRLGSMMA